MISLTHAISYHTMCFILMTGAYPRYLKGIGSVYIRHVLKLFFVHLILYDFMALGITPNGVGGGVHIPPGQPHGSNTIEIHICLCI